MFSYWSQNRWKQSDDWDYHACWDWARTTTYKSLPSLKSFILCHVRDTSVWYHPLDPFQSHAHRIFIFMMLQQVPWEFWSGTENKRETHLPNVRGPWHLRDGWSPERAFNKCPWHPVPQRSQATRNRGSLLTHPKSPANLCGIPTLSQVYPIPSLSWHSIVPKSILKTPRSPWKSRHSTESQTQSHVLLPMYICSLCVTRYTLHGLCPLKGGTRADTMEKPKQ